MLSLKRKAQSKNSCNVQGAMGGRLCLTELLDVVSNIKYESVVINEKMCPCNGITPFFFTQVLVYGLVVTFMFQ